MENKFNNYTLSNEEIEKILEQYDHLIKKATKNDDECAQKIRIAIYRKLSKNT